MNAEKERKGKTVLEMSAEEARDFFLQNECFCNVELPPYFNFEPLLKEVNRFLTEKKSYESVVKKGPNGKRACWPSEFEKVNHLIIHNKDGAYAWRPLQLLHPVIYISLVHVITSEENWKQICERFKCIRGRSIVSCLSMPREAEEEKTQRATQIFYWWTRVEQKSIELSLDFDFLFHTDVTDCYGSIYTHAIPWALHGIPRSKKERRNEKLIGNKIDRYIRHMTYGQTNGIPQGSVLMDFIAEMVLGFADLRLTEKLGEENINKNSEDLKILRYRDDYRVFVNDHQLGQKVIKALAEVLIDLGMKLNSEKTNVSNSVIRSSIKADKLAWITSKQKGKDLREDLLLCHELSEKFPNSGSLIKALLSFYDDKVKELQAKRKEMRDFNAVPLIAIVVDIAFRNPRTYAVCAAILSYLFSMLPDEETKSAVLRKVYKRFKKLPNTALMDVWLQRMALSIAPDWPFDAPLCKVVRGEKVELWNNEWLEEGELKKIISSQKVLDEEVLKEMKGTPIIKRSEFDKFLKDYFLNPT